MAQWFYLDGAAHEFPDGEELPDGAVVIERAPGLGERIDPETGAITLDNGLLADLNADPEAVKRAHAVKAAEAALILSGASLTCGLLFDEAQALGIALADLAQQVIDAAAADRAAEVARRVLKAGV